MSDIEKSQLIQLGKQIDNYPWINSGTHTNMAKGNKAALEKTSQNENDNSAIPATSTLLSPLRDLD